MYNDDTAHARRVVPGLVWSQPRPADSGRHDLLLGIVYLTGWVPAVYSHVTHGPAIWELGPFASALLAAILSVLLDWWDR